MDTQGISGTFTPAAETKLSKDMWDSRCGPKDLLESKPTNNLFIIFLILFLSFIQLCIYSKFVNRTTVFDFFLILCFLANIKRKKIF